MGCREDISLEKIYETRKKKLIERYAKSKRYKMLIIYIMIAIMFILLFVGLSIGGASYSVGESWRALVLGFLKNKIEMTQSEKIIWELRVPRVLMALTSGMGLSIAGLLMQSILHNPLASPYTLGISAASSFGAALSIVLGITSVTIGSFHISPTYSIAFYSFIASMIATLMVYILSGTRRISAETLILFGVAVNFLFSAATSFLQYIGSEEQLAALVYWMFGSLSKSTWSKLSNVVVVVVISYILMYIQSWSYNALLLGDEVALGLGIEVRKLRIRGLILASFLTSVIVSLLGPIGFIGLIAPHISRMIIGTDLRYLFPMTAIMGACLLMTADILSCVVLSPLIIPVGILTSFIGVPLLIYLLMRKEHRL